MSRDTVLPKITDDKVHVQVLAGDDVITIYSRSGIITLRADQASALVGDLVCAGAAMVAGKDYPFVVKPKVVH